MMKANTKTYYTIIGAVKKVFANYMGYPKPEKNSDKDYPD